MCTIKAVNEKKEIADASYLLAREIAHGMHLGQKYNEANKDWVDDVATTKAFLGI